MARYVSEIDFEGGEAMTQKKIHILTRDVEILDAETQLTRALICINPHEKSTEYTDLSQVWHDAKEEPKKRRLIVGIDDDGASIYKCIDQDNSDWLSFAECNGLTRWAYIEDLLPKGGKLCKNKF